MGGTLASRLAAISGAPKSGMTGESVRKRGKFSSSLICRGGRGAAVHVASKSRRAGAGRAWGGGGRGREGEPGGDRGGERQEGGGDARAGDPQPWGRGRPAKPRRASRRRRGDADRGQHRGGGGVSDPAVTRHPAHG